MKKILFFLGCLTGVVQTSTAQSNNKTNLSLQISSAAAANRTKLAGYVWSRTVQVFVSGELKVTTVSSVAIGADGKVVTTAVTSTPATPPPKGLKANSEKKKMAEMKTYVDDAISVTSGYLYLSKGKMVDFLDKGTVSQADNTITIVGSNVNKPKDQLNLNVTKKTFEYLSQSFKSTVANGDPIEGTANYKTFDNGLTAFSDGVLELPVKNMKLVISNSSYAKKLK
jgi:hypothetical protein